VNAGLVLISYLLTPLILACPRLYWAAAPFGVLTSALIVIRGRKKLKEALILTIYILFGLLILGLIAAGEIF